MTRWLFANTSRLAMAVVLFVVTGLGVAVLMLALRINQMDRAAGPVNPMAQPSPLATGDGAPLATPTPDPTTEPLSQPDQSITQRAFPEAGDPRSVALEAINEWLAWDFPGLEDDLLPGVLEEAQANPPQRGVRVDGAAEVVKDGPTASTVRVPTTEGSLLVDLVVYEGKWMVEAMGWAG